MSVRGDTGKVVPFRGCIDQESRFCIALRANRPDARISAADAAEEQRFSIQRPRIGSVAPRLLLFGFGQTLCRSGTIGSLPEQSNIAFSIGRENDALSIAAP